MAEKSSMTVRVPDDKKLRLVELAKTMEVSRSDLVERFIDLGLSELARDDQGSAGDGHRASRGQDG